MTKSIGVLISLFAFLLFSCKSEPIEPFEFTVGDYNQSVGSRVAYKFTERELTVFFIGKLEGQNDSVLYSTSDIPKSKIRRIAAIEMDSLSDSYTNNCIIDGDVKMVGLKKDSIMRVIQLNNYYHPELSPVFEIINKMVPEKLKMSHDKEKLLKKMDNCKSFKIVKKRAVLRK